MNKNIVVIYHGGCHDGFGGAYAAWKKFGDSATYIPAYDRITPEANLEGKEVYIIDFSFPKAALLDLEQKTKRLVILDHHIGVQEAVEAVREHVFANDQSGAGIAWRYFHTNIPFPKFLAYIEDNDLWRYALPFSREVRTFLTTISFDFSFWDKLAKEFEEEISFQKYAERGKTYTEYFNFICNELASGAELVEFDGREIFAVNAPRFFRSYLGHELALKHPPFSIVWYPHHGSWHFSLRGDGSIDLTKIVQRYGGSGHKNASGFELPFNVPFPFKKVNNKKKE